MAAYTEERFSTEAQTIARTLFQNDGYVAIMGACVATVEPGTGAKLDQELVMVLVPEDEDLSQEGKDRFVSQVRILAKECGARMVATISESWYRKLPIDHPDPLGTPVKDAPDRKEAIVVSIETTTATASHFADIHRNGDGEAVLGEFAEASRTPIGQVAGRFTRLLPCHHEN